jgi:hypothetical protein
MQTLNTIRRWGSAVRPRVAHLHGVATVGAVLACFAVVVNGGGKLSKTNAGSGSPVGEARRAFTEHPVEAASMHAPDSATHAESGTASAASSAETGGAAVVQLASDVAPASSGPIEQPRPGDEIQLQKPDLAAAEPAAQATDDQQSAELRKRAAIVGVWAPDDGGCSARDFREGLLPAVINTDGAWAGETFCVFKDQKQTDSSWKVVASCSSPRGRWTANVRLTVNGNRLTWTSKRGTQVYSRCAPDVLMAEAAATRGRVDSGRSPGAR